MRNTTMVMVAVGLMSCGSMVYAGTATVNTFTGGDVVNGLDLEGNFLYATDVGWDGTAGTGGGTIREVTFTPALPDEEGVDPLTEGFYLGGCYAWPAEMTSLEYGDSADDDTLEGIMSNRVKATGSGTTVWFDLGFEAGPQLVEGKPYKLQLGFATSYDDYPYHMCWDVTQFHWEDREAGTGEHELLQDNIEVYGNNDEGIIMTYEFTATSEEAESLTICVVHANRFGEEPTYPPWDERYPAFNMMTLEDVSEGWVPPGDANGDGAVTDADAAILATNWQACGVGWAQGDFNGDGCVTDADAAILATHWQEGAGEGTAPVPEPAAIVLLIGLTALVGLVRSAKAVRR